MLSDRYGARSAPVHITGASGLLIRFYGWTGTMSADKERNYTYILRCSDESLYTGWTNNLEGRIKMHNSGKGAKYTRSRGPVELVYFEEFLTKSEAMGREAAIKKMKRSEKLKLIEEKGKNNI